MASRLAALGRRRSVQIALALLIVLRMALPEVLRRVAERQASAALQARVEIGDVDLALLRAGVVLEDVAVRELEDPPPGAEAVPPLVAWKRLAVRVRWLPLLWKTVRVQAIELDGLRVALDRLRDGNINLLALVPKSEPVAEGEAPAEAAGSGWHIGIDRIALRDGGVRFRDLVFPDAEPIQIVVPFIDVADLQFAPGLYGEPARVRVKLHLDEGTLGVAARLGVTDDLGLRVDATVKAARLPLKRTRLYLADVGWSDLSGAFSTAVRYRREPGVREEVRGHLFLDDFNVFVGGIHDPTLAWKRLAVHVDPVDLLARRAQVARVELAAPRVLVRLGGGDVLPFLAAVSGGSADAAGATKTAGEPPPPWKWAVGQLRLAEGTIKLERGEDKLDVTLGVEATHLAMDTVADLDVRAGVGDGTVTATGQLGLSPIGVDTTLHVEALPLPVLATVGAGLPAELVQTGTCGADLTIAAGGRAAEQGGLHVRGEITLGELWVAKGDGREFAVGARRIATGIEDVHVPAVLPVDPGAAAKAPTRVVLRSLTLEQPYVLVTRTEAGLVLPALASTPPAEPSPAAAPPPPPTASAPTEIALETLAVHEGRALLSDRTVTPFYWGGLVAMEVDAQRLRLPGPSLGRLRLRARSATEGTLELQTSGYPAGGPIEFRVADIALPPFNPLMTARMPYSIARGTFSAVTKGSFARNTVETTTDVTLRDFDVGGAEGDPLFEREFGVPMTLALALLRDLDGDIALDIPVSVDESGTSVGIGTVVGGALRRALLGALTSPLKLLGSVASAGGKVEALTPAPIAFRPGRAELVPGSDAQVQQIALFVASRPGIAVALEPIVAARDVRWIAEQSLAADLGRAKVLGAVGNLASGGARSRILTALAARAVDQDVALDEADARTLDEWLAKRPAPDAATLAQLADARTARIAEEFERAYGLSGARVSRKPPRIGGEGDTPGVAFGFAAVAR